jgi:hypothetical protein
MREAGRINASNLSIGARLSPTDRSAYPYLRMTPVNQAE